MLWESIATELSSLIEVRGGIVLEGVQIRCSKQLFVMKHDPVQLEGVPELNPSPPLHARRPTGLHFAARRVSG